MRKELFKHLDKMATKIPVSDIMVKDIKTLKDENSAKDAVDMMSNLSISGIMIIDKDNKPMGMISEGDLIKKVFHKDKDPKKVKISEIMSKELFTIKPDLSIGECSEIMKNRKISKLPVMDKGKIVGYVTKADLLEELNNIYLQNRRLLWLTVMVTVQFIVIAVLLIGYVTK